MFSTTPDSIKQLKQRYGRTVNRMKDLTDRMERRKLTPAERDEFLSLKQQSDSIYRAIQAKKLAKRGSGSRTDSFTGRKYKEVRGTPNERLSPNQSFADYVRATSDDYRSSPHDLDWDAYWTAKIRGYDNAETRALTGFGEDISSGPGAGAGIVGQLWSSQVVDLIRARTFTDALGVTTMPLHGEITNLPHWQADVQPVFVSEGTAVQGDITPQVNTLQFSAAGAVMDFAPVSRNLIDDAINTGGVNALIQHSIAEKYSRVVDQAALYGIQGSPGNPGLCAEQNLLTATSTNATTYVDLSNAAKAVRAQNVEPNGFLWHPSTMAGYAQLQDTLHQPLRMTPDIADLKYVSSGLLNYQTESAAGVFGAGALSSIFVGAWDWMVIGWRTMGVETTVLTERNAELNQYVFLSRARFSIRTLRVNQTFCRLLNVTY